jgi:hypothetical protein
MISERCIIDYIWWGILRDSSKFCMGDKSREEMEGGKRDEMFFSALLREHIFTNCLLKQL